MPLTDKSPKTWLGSGYTASPGKIELSTTALLKEISDAEANENSGDFRKVLSSIVEGLYSQYSAKYNALPEADRPARMMFNRSISVDQATGSIVRNYNLRFELEAATINIVREPEPQVEVLPPAKGALKKLPSASPDAQVA